jgi:hypothetical protein
LISSYGRARLQKFWVVKRFDLKLASSNLDSEKVVVLDSFPAPSIPGWKSTGSF